MGGVSIILEEQNSTLWQRIRDARTLVRAAWATLNSEKVVLRFPNASGEQGQQPGLSPHEFRSLRNWFASLGRKPADLAFTSGVARDAARAFEESGFARGECICVKCGLRQEPAAFDLENFDPLF